MSDALLYVTKMGCLYWLKNETALAYGRAEYNKVENPSRETGRMKVELGRYHQATKGEIFPSITLKHGSCGYEQININGFI